MRSVKGFTLIELMVALAVLAILVTTAVPSFRNSIVSSRLDSVASDVVNAISFARSESIKRNSTIQLCRVSSATATTCAGAAGEWQFWAILSGSTVLRRGVINTYGGDLEVTSDLNADTVSFGGDGLARSAGNIISESQVSICAASGPSDSTREVDFGAASRISVNKVAGACP